MSWQLKEAIIERSNNLSFLTDFNFVGYYIIGKQRYLSFLTDFNFDENIHILLVNFIGNSFDLKDEIYNFKFGPVKPEPAKCPLKAR